MEFFGILLAMPVTFVTSLVYAALIIPAGRRWIFVQWALLVSAGLVGVFVLSEGLALLIFGAKGSYARFGHFFTVVHFVNCIFTPPAVAHVAFYLVSRLTKRIGMQFIAVVSACWFTCIAAIFGHFVIDEAIVGPDAEKPFYMSSATGPNCAARPLTNVDYYHCELSGLSCCSIAPAFSI
jgi:hypothetical protein